MIVITLTNDITIKLTIDSQGQVILQSVLNLRSVQRHNGSQNITQCRAKYDTMSKNITQCRGKKTQ